MTLFILLDPNAILIAPSEFLIEFSLIKYSMKFISLADRLTIIKDDEFPKRMNLIYFQAESASRPY